MAIDIKNILEIVQRKIAAVDSTTPVEDISYLLKLAKRLDGSTIITYATSLDLPDPATSKGQIAYVANTDQLVFCNGQWDTLSTEEPFIEPVIFYTNGTAYGYKINGYGSQSNKVSYTSDGNATFITNNNASATIYPGGYNTEVAGYNVGGENKDDVDKLLFASDVMNNIGLGLLVRNTMAPASVQTEYYGYSMGGATTDPGSSYAFIQKFDFLSEAAAVDVGTLETAVQRASSASTPEYGYAIGGSPSAPAVANNWFQRMSFANDTSTAAKTGGTLIQARTYHSGAGVQSVTHGYVAGGHAPPITATIERFPFAADNGSSISVGNLTQARYGQASACSTTNGYAQGGFAPPYSNVIDKYPFAADLNATDVGDLTVATRAGGAFND